MIYVIQTALELGFMYALVAMALFLSYRILDIADLTTDSGFVLGAAVSVTVAAAGHPFLAILAARRSLYQLPPIPVFFRSVNKVSCFRRLTLELQPMTIRFTV